MNIKSNKITIVVANFYPDISSQLLKGAENELKKKKYTKMNTHTEFKYSSINCYKIVEVPGIFELPLATVYEIKKCDGIIALGCVIKGKTPHFDFICKSVTDAIMNLSIQYKTPIGNGILTCLNKKQAEERANIKKKNKGKDAALATFSLLDF